MRKNPAVFLLTFVSAVLFALPSYAATKSVSSTTKTKPKTTSKTTTKKTAKTKNKSKTKTKSSTVSTVSISYKWRRDRKAIYVYFRNLNRARSVFYTLAYQTDGKDEGVAGTLDGSGGSTATRELLLGTCSSGVCRWHPNVKNIRFEAAIELLSGQTATKNYWIR